MAQICARACVERYGLLMLICSRLRPRMIPGISRKALPFVKLRGGRLPGSALMLGAALPDLAFVAGGYRFSGPAHELYGPLVFVPTLMSIAGSRPSREGARG